MYALIYAVNLDIEDLLDLDDLINQKISDNKDFVEVTGESPLEEADINYISELPQLPGDDVITKKRNQVVVLKEVVWLQSAITECLDDLHSINPKILKFSPEFARFCRDMEIALNKQLAEVNAMIELLEKDENAPINLEKLQMI